VDPNTGRPYAANKGVRNVAIDGDVVAVDVVLGYPAARQFEAIRTQFADALRAVPGVVGARVEVSQQIAAHTVQRGVKLLPNVKNIVAVAS
ncbi:iron-sulfur cluster assembly protein, partial [Paraburkholderia sp. SIMBA_009]